MKKHIIFAAALSVLLSGNVWAAEVETETETEAREEKQLADWKISVDEFSFTDRIDSEFMYYEPDQGNQYLTVSASVTNTGKKAGTFLPSIALNNDTSVTVFYAEEYEYPPTGLLGFPDCLNASTINPLSSKDGIITFSVPDLVAESEEPLKIVFSAGDEEIEFELR